MTGIQPQIFKACTPDNRRAVWRHRAQTSPESRLLDMTAAWIEIANHHLQRFTTRLQQLGIKTNNLRHSANTNAVIETGNAIL